MEKDKKNLKSNKGFTLVEVLIAIAILAIIVVPLLRAFVVSANTNAKARRTMRATTLAQNVIEELKAYSLDESAEQYLGRKTGNHVIDDAKESYETVKYADGVHSAVTIDDEGNIVGRVDGQYDFVLQEVVQEHAEFDVEIQIRKPEAKDASLAGLGSYDLVNITSMNRSDCAYFAQEKEAHSIVGAEYVRRAEIYDSDSEVTAAQFIDMMTRTITIDIATAADASQTVKVTYEYTVPDGYVNADSKEYTEYTTIFDNYASKEPLQAVYLYYYPLYGITTRDTIIVNNLDDIDVDVYLIKMKDPAIYTTFDDSNYKPYVYVNETDLTEANTSNLKLCTNVDDDNLISFYNGTGSSTSLLTTDLGNAEEIQNLYDITVRVYRHDDSAFTVDGGTTKIAFDDDMLVSTFTGTVLDKAE